MTLTVAQIISIAKVSQYLCANDINKTGLYGAGTDLLLPRKLYTTRKDIEYQYSLDPSNEDIAATAAYLYALCGKWGLYAQAIVLNPGTSGGTISRTAPSPYQFVVDASTSFIIDGQSSKTITAFIGYNLIFTRGGVTQNAVDVGDGSSYYSWTKSTGSFICYPSANTGELFGLFPI
ncbi:MAG: hypothetical protein V4547_16870 [Bacteroidota bacterium]